ncbi:hypothetical protein ACHAPE_010331 [Trichoderma viride]
MCFNVAVRVADRAEIDHGVEEVIEVCDLLPFLFAFASYKRLLPLGYFIHGGYAPFRLFVRGTLFTLPGVEIKVNSRIKTGAKIGIIRAKGDNRATLGSS